ncbi:uncharacterized protein VTP21DRAFT_9624 [Calcarisporiella thermophila]|uniref:uncharacterized protein n=1 Tax=Calcarisporiella thermophila TaxID=911321 RepID=UPI003742AC51
MRTVLIFLLVVVLAQTHADASANPYADSLRAIPKVDHTMLKNNQIEAAEKYAMLAMNAHSPFLKPGKPFKCGCYCDRFPNTTTLDYFTLQGPQDATGYVARDDLRKTFIVGFRGSASIQTWISNAHLKLVPVGGNVPGKIHEGFRATHLVVAKRISTLLQKQWKQYPDYTVEVVGHSLGGALATVHAAYLAADVKVDLNKIILVTLEEPLVGDSTFANYVSNLNILGYRLTNKQDVFVHLPPEFMGYKHRGNELYYSEYNKVILCLNANDKNCSPGVPIERLNALDHFYWGKANSAHCGFDDTVGVIVSLLGFFLSLLRGGPTTPL